VYEKTNCLLASQLFNEWHWIVYVVVATSNPSFNARNPAFVFTAKLYHVTRFGSNASNGWAGKECERHIRVFICVPFPIFCFPEIK